VGRLPCKHCKGLHLHLCSVLPSRASLTCLSPPPPVPPRWHAPLPCTTLHSSTRGADGQSCAPGSPAKADVVSNVSSQKKVSCTRTRARPPPTHAAGTSHYHQSARMTTTVRCGTHLVLDVASTAGVSHIGCPDPPTPPSRRGWRAKSRAGTGLPSCEHHKRAADQTWDNGVISHASVPPTYPVQEVTDLVRPGQTKVRLCNQ
jgi:hypothetical protein